MYKFINEPNVATITLDFPITGPEGDIKQLILRPPQVTDILAAGDITIPANEVILMANLCNVPIEMIHALHGQVDYPKLIKAFLGFKKPPKKKASA